MSLALNTVHVGDWRALLGQMDDESVNCVVTSPPYWGLRNYGVPGQLGLEASPQEYVDKLVEGFRDVRRVLRSDGVLWLNLGDCYATGAGKVGDHPGGGEQGARWKGDGTSKGYRGERLANGRGDSPAILRVKTRATRDGSMSSMGPMTQPNRMPIDGLKPKDLVGIPWRVAFALQADGWWLRADNVWHKPNPMPESVRDRTTRAHEYIFQLTKSELYWYDADAIKEPCVYGDHPRNGVPTHVTQSPGQPVQSGITKRRRSGNKERKYRADHGGVESRKTNQWSSVPWEDLDGHRNKRSVWTISTGAFAGAHFAVFPPALVEPCVKAGCPEGGVVLDPFGGSGTVGQVAADLGRQWILLELNPEYAEMARKRVAQRTSMAQVGLDGVS